MSNNTESPEIDEITLHDFFFAAAIAGMASHEGYYPHSVVSRAKEIADLAIQAREQ